MGIDDMMGSGFDADSARYDRMNRTQQADFAPGQSGVFNDMDAFAQSSIPNNTGQMNDIFSTDMTINNPFAQSSNMGIPAGNTMQPMQQPQQKTAEDQFFDAVKKGATGSFNIIKEIAGSFPNLTYRWYSEWGKTATIVGVVVAGLGIVLKLFGFGDGLQVAIGGLVSSAFGVLIWFLLTDKAKTCRGKYKDSEDTAPPVNNNINTPLNPAPVMGAGGMDFGMNDLDDIDNNFDEVGFSDDTDTDSDEYEEDIYGFDELDSYNEPDEPEQDDGMNPEDALNSLPDVPQGMYERSYLWGMFTKVLPTMKRDFAKMRDVDESDDAFLYWEDKLREAASVAGCKEDYLPNLLSLQENLFTVIVTCDRPQGFKPDLVATELSNIYAYSDGGEKNENVFAKSDTIGATCRITIFNGASAMISLKDMMLQEQDFILDTSNYIPVIFGVDQRGKVIKEDLKKLESIIVTGMPRSGKSWFVQAILTQMCAFISPSELHIYIGDPKEGISDFKAFILPHVKRFESKDERIVDMLRNLVKVEGPRRKKIIGDAGFVNIWDYKARYPDVKIPIIYVVVDEIVTLASRMDKETNTEFRMLLRELISQLPALGIRALLIPHVLNNDIIEKKTSDLVPCKVSVKGNADHIEKATGAKPKEFPYKLVNSGDMAMKLSSVPNVMYVHGPALTDSNTKNNELFDYLRRVWSKLEPDEIADSVSNGADIDRQNNMALQELNDNVDDVSIGFEEPGIDDLF